MYNKEQPIIREINGVISKLNDITSKLNGNRSAWLRQEKLSRQGTKSAAGASVSA
jgi:hypothetical protein